ncbi:MAG: hypothetical protein ABIJ03_03050 [Patescibacteria group bacterium]
MSKEKAIVIKFGGSASTDLDGANIEYFDDFFQEIGPLIMATMAKAAFIIGGGPRVRELQKVCNDPDEKDRIGIQATQQHAWQMGEVAKKHGLSVIPSVPTSPDEAKKIISGNAEFAIALGGLQIGQSTDAVALETAAIFKDQGLEPIIVILSNVLYIFTEDPKVNPDAQPIVSASIGSLIDRGILAKGKEHWKPGMNWAFDPVATDILGNLADPYKILFTHAKNLDDVKRFIEGKSVEEGTVVDGTEKVFTLK